MYLFTFQLNALINQQYLFNNVFHEHIYNGAFCEDLLETVLNQIQIKLILLLFIWLTVFIQSDFQLRVKDAA